MMTTVIIISYLVQPIT